MSLLKKIISSVCAVSMLSAFMVSAINVQAAENPVFTAALDTESYNSETGEGRIVVSVSGIPEAIGPNDIVSAFNMEIVIPSEDFDVSYYDKGSARNKPYEKNELQIGDWGTFQASPYVDETQSIAPLGYKMALFEDIDLFEIKFKVLDPTKDNTITITDAMFTVDHYDDETGEDFIGYIEHRLDKGTLDVEYPTIDGTGGGDITITIPGSGGSNTSEGVAIDPEKIGAEGENGVFTTSDPDFEGDKAVAKLANVTANNEGVMVWNVTGTRAAGGEENVNMDFEIPNTEGEVSVGLIVGYNEADWSSVVINSVTTQAQ